MTQQHWRGSMTTSTTIYYNQLLPAVEDESNDDNDNKQSNNDSHDNARDESCVTSDSSCSRRAPGTTFVNPHWSTSISQHQFIITQLFIACIHYNKTIYSTTENPGYHFQCILTVNCPLLKWDSRLFNVIYVKKLTSLQLCIRTM